jgi:hypothetical protein
MVLRIASEPRCFLDKFCRTALGFAHSMEGEDLKRNIQTVSVPVLAYFLSVGLNFSNPAGTDRTIQERTITHAD